jgi:hypothetical protein
MSDEEFDIDTRRFTSDDYGEFVDMLRENGNPYVPHLGQLPSIGVIAEDDDGIAGFLFLFADYHSSTAIADYFTVRSDVGPHSFVQVVNDLCERASDEAKLLGYERLVAYVPKSFANVCKRYGWTPWPIDVHGIQRDL